MREGWVILHEIAGQARNDGGWGILHEIAGQARNDGG